MPTCPIPLEFVRHENGQAATGFFEKVKMKMCSMKKIIVFSLGVLSTPLLFSQDGNAGIQQANTLVRSYFDNGTLLMYAVGAILGLIGAVKVYQKWNAGDPDTGKVAAAWFGSCIFLVVVTTVIRSFFGL
jgi:hypothetical protein